MNTANLVVKAPRISLPRESYPIIQYDTLARRKRVMFRPSRGAVKTQHHGHNITLIVDADGIVGVEVGE